MNERDKRDMSRIVTASESVTSVTHPFRGVTYVTPGAWPDLVWAGRRR